MVSLVGLIILMPVFVAMAVLIGITMGGPVFFSQTRIGRYGRPFRIIKFRTMQVDEDELVITIKNDRRITSTGAFLRRYRLDELPQLWNVLKGEMSLVGPRPDVPGYADKLTGDDRQILALRPGITGPATLKYANEEELLALQPDPLKYNDEFIFPDKVKINREYMFRRNFLLDIKIILYTIIGKKLSEEWAQ